MMVGDTFILHNRSTRTDGRHTYIAGGAMGMMVGDVWSLRGIWLEEVIGSSLVPSQRGHAQLCPRRYYSAE